MALSFKLLGFPLIVLIVSIILSPGAAGGGTFAASGQPVTFSGAGINGTNTIDCSNYVAGSVIPGLGGSPCFHGTSLPTSTTLSCNNPASSKAAANNPTLLYRCWILDACPSDVTSSLTLYCDSPLARQGGTFLDKGVVAQISAKGSISAKTSQIFGFGSIGTEGFVTMIVVAISIAALLGITVFSSGENAESVHIMFIGGMLMGLWAILSATEGYVTNSSNSFFVQMNSAIPPLGSLFYIALTFIFVMGVIGAVSRGGTGS